MSDPYDSVDLPLVLIGVDHRSAPIELREKLAYGSDEAEECLVHLAAQEEIDEAFLLSTCNRTEVLLTPSAGADPFAKGFEQVFTRRASEIGDEGRFYVRRGEEAARHVLSVAAGLESMVLGEPEIQGQVRQAAALAESLGVVGPLLRRVLRSAAHAGRRARSETGIGAGAVSFGYAVVELGRSIFERLEDSSILVIGAGETALAVSRSLLERGARGLRVANRSEARIEAFRRELPQAVGMSFDDRYAALAESDIVVAATGSAEPILQAAQLEAAIRERRSRPMLIVDLGLPRDVEAAAAEIGNLFLHDIDSLQQLIERNLKQRREHLPLVTKILDEEQLRLMQWYEALAVEPIVAGLQKRAEAIRREEVASMLDRIPAELHQDVDRLTRTIVRKLLHHPSTTLREGQGRARVDRLAAVRELFRLEPDDE